LDWSPGFAWGSEGSSPGITKRWWVSNLLLSLLVVVPLLTYRSGDLFGFIALFLLFSVAAEMADCLSMGY
jgi:hypothetical protein